MFIQNLVKKTVVPVMVMAPAASLALAVLLGCQGSTEAQLTGEYLDCRGLTQGTVSIGPDGGTTITGTIGGKPLKVIKGKVTATVTIETK